MKEDTIKLGLTLTEKTTGVKLTVIEISPTFNGGIYAIYCKPYGKFYYDRTLNTLPTWKNSDTFPDVYLSFRGWAIINLGEGGEDNAVNNSDTT